jgi:hypothetical protein
MGRESNPVANRETLQFYDPLEIEGGLTICNAKAILKAFFPLKNDII